MGYIWIAARSCADKSFLYTRLLYFLRILWACAARFYVRICWSSHQNVLLFPGQGLGWVGEGEAPRLRFPLFGFIAPSWLFQFSLWLGPWLFSPPQIPGVLFKASWLQLSHVPQGCVQQRDPTSGFLLGKESSHGAVLAKRCAWPLCTHTEGRTPPIFHPSRCYDGAWMTFNLFTEPGKPARINQP